MKTIFSRAMQRIRLGDNNKYANDSLKRSTTSPFRSYSKTNEELFI